MANKYFDNWTSLAEIERDFNVSTGLEDRDILIAVYTYEDYSGQAFVLYEKGGELFEVHGSHCSCNGLEGEGRPGEGWRPELTTWGALGIRTWLDWPKDFQKVVKGLIQEGLNPVVRKTCWERLLGDA